MKGLHQIKITITITEFPISSYFALTSHRNVAQCLNIRGKRFVLTDNNRDEITDANFHLLENEDCIYVLAESNQVPLS